MIIWVGNWETKKYTTVLLRMSTELFKTCRRYKQTYYRRNMCVKLVT